MIDLQVENRLGRPTTAPDWLVKWNGRLYATTGMAERCCPAFLAATTDELLLSGPSGEFRFPIRAIRKLGRGGINPWFFGSIRVHHAIADYPRSLQFRPTYARVADVLRELSIQGYPVARQP
ncbi:MAG TPA: hypothetical protein VHE61_08300 [Opitutaceae bacterium]|nr:hypothetical protein [Opitutaceae bacterium]